LSPGGTWLAYVRQDGSEQQVVLRSLTTGAERKTLSVLSRRERIRWCDWGDAQHLLCGTVLPVRRPDRISEKTHLYVIDTRSQRARELNTRLSDPVRDQVIDLSASRTGSVLLQHDPVGLGYPEVAELNLETGALRRVIKAHPPVRRWISDGRGAVRLGIGYDGNAATVFAGQDDDWHLWRSQSLTDLEAIGPLAFGSDASELYVLKHHEGRAALFRMNPWTESPPALVFAHAEYDVQGPLVFDPRTRKLQAVRYIANREQQHFLELSAAQTQAHLDRELPGTVNLTVDTSIDGRRQLVRSLSDVQSPSWYLYDADKQTLALLGHEYPELEGTPLAPMRPVSYQARDGERIPAYLTLPPTPLSGPLPAIVLPHGGPESRALQAFDPLVQFLAAQGYAVLQMNFRGSFGYGAAFAAAGVGQWGGVIHNDITDGTRWLVDQEIADPARICIVGESFGGYAALLGAARESQWYACAISFAGVSDLMAFRQYTQRLQSAAMWSERLGSNQQALWQMSPLARVHAIETPIFLMHGRLDPVVPVSQTRRLARALRLADKPHRSLERMECDHEMTIEACRIEFFTEAATFLDASFVPGAP
jgi:dipeptidyl aminopeptidase/acylaminoacyl peptidase